MAKSRITKKDIGNTVEFYGNSNAPDKYFIGKIVHVANRIAKIEFEDKGETFTAYLETNCERIAAVHRVVGYMLSVEEVLKAAQTTA